MANEVKPTVAPCPQKRLRFRKAVKGDTETIPLEHAIDLGKRWHEPRVILGIVVLIAPAIATSVVDHIRWVRNTTIHACRWHLLHHFHAVTRDNPVDEFIHTSHKTLVSSVHHPFSGSSPAPGRNV